MKLKESELLKKIKERLPISNMAKPFNQLYLQINIKKDVQAIMLDTRTTMQYVVSKILFSER